MRPIELLSPAKTAEIGIEAINHGADAVYIGAPQFGARSAAGNTIADIATLTAYAHRFNARVYVALNTVLTDNELPTAEKMTWQLYEAGADALIVQDMGLLQLNLPPIELHASTQTDNRTVEKVRFLEEAGFAQIVLARELSLEQIRAITSQTNARIECFVHGALCVCYSGQCYASQATRGRSANRGECAQLCRLPYSLVDADGKPLAAEGHLLSLKDLDLSAHLGTMLEAGVSSFKIEGRLKEMDYVKNVTAYYRQRLDGLLEGSSKYEKSSQGKVKFFFTPDPERTFHRGGTDYFLNTRASGLVQPLTPKSIGQPVGMVQNTERAAFTVRGDVQLHNDDGLCYAAHDGSFVGIKVNRVEGRRVFPFKMPILRVGTVLYRNGDAEFEKTLSKKSAERKMPLTIHFSETEKGFALKGEIGHSSVTLHFDNEKEMSNKSLPETIDNLRTQFGKLGNTDFELTEMTTDLSASWFIPASRLSEWRRLLSEEMANTLKADYRAPKREAPTTTPQYPEQKLSYLGNVTNEKAREFYRTHGVTEVEPALETEGTLQAGEPVMVTKYCLKFEMGWCPSKQHPTEAPREPLFLQGKNDRFQLSFDCKRCEMRLGLT